jgi:putative autoinducer-2 (AI-2) aldolase
MGRNIFQSDAPTAMIQAIHKVVHEDANPREALELYETLKNEGEKVGVGNAR